ncbi:aflatoxin B1-aldehyde reductase [Sclerotinia borealis F-4128]|uniref:Aflatoxin B1-aldehyde reductase n=1 Tax=Sclerotinia borealis (strain F-4128) TaxID=1432307 RepID=W9CI57_SCLBF|nr:aflatoxin B1-aldehyde reductase [Sclerotinia borealis F-4128]
MVTSKCEIKVVFGSMTIGRPGDAIRTSTIRGAAKILDVFQAHGHSEVDSARVYGGGSTEERLAEVDWQSRGLIMQTKLYPTKGKGMSWLTSEEYTLSPADVRRGFEASMKALNTDRVEMFYLHGPDRNTPLEETLSEINKLHQEGRFDRFGISYFASWEVAQICDIAEKNGWIKPSVYQGLYNTFNRSVEAELIPCLRHYGIALYACQPLAGGFLTSKYHREQTEYETNSRFDPSKPQGKLHHSRYMNERNLYALEDLLRPVIKKHGLTEAECGLRWAAHHSFMKKELGDGVIVGASSPKQLEDNLTDLEKGRLPDDVVEALEEGWKHISGTYKYFH